MWSHPAHCLGLVVCCRCCQVVIGLATHKWTLEEYLSPLHSPLTKITVGLFFFFKFSVTQTSLSGFINAQMMNKFLQRNSFKSLLFFISPPSYWHKANQRYSLSVSWCFGSLYSQHLLILCWVLILIHFVINLTSSGNSLLPQKTGCSSTVKDWKFIVPLSP